jgi:hypothetical protein
LPDAASRYSPRGGGDVAELLEAGLVELIVDGGMHSSLL